MDEVNFDLERMKKSIESGYITLPSGLTMEQMREFLENEAKRIKEEKK